jgi:hypothetical protein
MMENAGHQELIAALLRKTGHALTGQEPRLVRMSGDGSDRIFYRVGLAPGGSLIAVFPSPTLARGAAEQAAAFHIGVHLQQRGVPVPAIAGYDGANGLLLFADLGDVHLHAMVRQAGSFAEVEPLYRQALDVLLRLQLQGGRDFDPGWCWDTPRYDEQLMLARESDYFRFAFCRDFMGKNADDARLVEELRRLARCAAQEPAQYLLHRDFQSRNLLVHEAGVHVIDYQGARFGPLGYDLASLLLDPYAGLDPESRDRLFRYYVDRLSERMDVDRERFAAGYHCLALQRNLQILGAFAFLSGKKGKGFFARFIRPAAASLKALLDNGERFPALAALVGELLDQLEEMQFPQMDE